MKSLPFIITEFGIRLLLCLVWIVAFGLFVVALHQGQNRVAIIVCNVSWFSFILFALSKRRQ